MSLGAAPSGISTLSFRFWLKKNNTDTGGFFGDGRSNSGNGFFNCRTIGDTFMYYYAGNDTLKVFEVPNFLPSGDVWHHITITTQYWSGGWFKLYLDGVQKGTLQILDSANLKVPDGSMLAIGGFSYGALFPVRGIMDEFNIEKYVLQPDDIAAYYERTFLRYQDSRAQLILPSGDAEALVLQQASLYRFADTFRVQDLHGRALFKVDSANSILVPSMASIGSAIIGSLTGGTGYFSSFRRGATALYEDHFAGLDTFIWTSGGAGLGWGLTMENVARYPMGWLTFSANASTGSATHASLYGNGGLGANQSPNFACAVEPSGEDLRNIASGFVGLFGGATARVGFIFASWGNANKHSVYCVATSGANESALAVAVVWFSGASGGAGYAHKYAVSVISGASALFYIDNTLRYSTGAAVLWPSCMNPMVWFSYAEPGATKTLYWRTDYFYVYGEPNNP